MNKKVKKIFSGFVVVFMYFLLVNKVSAAILSIEDVSKQFNETPEIKEFAHLGLILTSRVNTNDKTLDIYNESEKIISLKYTDNYIEYDNRDFVITKENCMRATDQSFALYGVIESIRILSGYEDKSFSESVKYTDTYDTVGYEIVTEWYDFSDEYEDSNSWGISGEYTKYFKMSLDTEKIDVLMSKYGVDLDYFDSIDTWDIFNEYFQNHFVEETNLDNFKKSYNLKNFDIESSKETLKLNIITNDNKIYQTIYTYKDGVLSYSKVGNKEIDYYFNELILEYLIKKYNYNSEKFRKYIYENNNLTLAKDGIEYRLEGFYSEEEMKELDKQWEEYYNSLTEEEKQQMQGMGYGNFLIFSSLNVDLINGLKTYDESLIPYYNIFEGENQKYTIETSKTLKFEIDAEFDLFDGVYIDGKKIDKSNYTASKGSTIITLKKEYLDKLKEGNHELKVTFTDGEFAQTNFKIEKPVENPKTGVVIKYGILLLLVLIGGFVYSGIRKQSKFPKHN